MRVKLRHAIIDAGLTQRVLAARVGISENRISAIVCGWWNPRIEEQDRIAAVLGRQASDLF